MTSILNEVMNSVGSGDNLSTLANAAGGDEKGVQSAVAMGLPMILGSMANTASSPGGSEAIAGALGQMGGANPVDNISGYLANPGAAANTGIVNTLLGGQMGTIQSVIASKTGLPPEVVGKVLTMITPVVAGFISKKFSGGKIDPAALTGLLGEESKSALASSPEVASAAKDILGSTDPGAAAGGLFKKVFGR